MREFSCMDDCPTNNGFGYNSREEKEEPPIEEDSLEEGEDEELGGTILVKNVGQINCSNDEG